MKINYWLLALCAGTMLLTVPARAQIELGDFDSMRAPKWRVALQGGYSYRIGKVQDTGNEVIDSHNKKLKTGFNYGADVTYHWSDGFGLGLKYNDMRSSSKDAVTVTYDAGGSESGMYNDVVDIRFIGAVVASRSVSASGKGIFFLDYGAGYLGYVDNGRLISQEIGIKGGTLGACMDVGYDYRLMNNLYLGATLSAVYGTLSSYTETVSGKTQKYTLGQDEKQGLMHLDLSIGIRYYL